MHFNRLRLLHPQTQRAANAEAATDLESLPNLPSVRIFEAFDATLGDVCFLFLAISITSSTLASDMTRISAC